MPLHLRAGCGRGPFFFTDQCILAHRAPKIKHFFRKIRLFLSVPRSIIVSVISAVKEANAMASRKRIVLCYVLLQASFWGMISSICAYQAAIVLDRGFTTGQAGIFCALCYLASLFTQPVIGGWADRHPSVPIKQLLIVMLLPAVALNLVFYFTRPGFALTALIISCSACWRRTPIRSLTRWGCSMSTQASRSPTASHAGWVR